MSANPNQVYDAIVVGSGIAGGWAAKELCENGLKTLVLERGPDVKHISDYPTASKDPWDFKNPGGKLDREAMKDYEKQNRTGYTVNEAHVHFFVKDTEHPYNETKRFDWIRGYQVGGRSLTWGRQSYRLSDIDFEANKKEGIAVDWPIRYKDIAPWYDRVEEFIGVTGQNEGLPQLPDGKFLPPMELNCIEHHLKRSIAKEFTDRTLTIGRVANITGDEKTFKGRTKCLYRNLCIRGCPFGSYFCSQTSTLPAAEETGNLTLQPDAIVAEIIYDQKKQKASGVKVIDRLTKKEMVFQAKVIFLCASTIASTAILLHSKSDRFPNGMGNDSGELGHNLMDHHFRVGAGGTHDDFKDQYYKGRRPNGIYIPRFRNLEKNSEKQSFLRGYGYQGTGIRPGFDDTIPESKFGVGLKKQLLKPGPWKMWLTGFGECLPYHENKMTLDYERLDQWGLPTVTFDAEFKENELKMREDMKEQAVEMLKKAGFKDIHTYDNIGAPGLSVHEMGTARMGLDPKTSVVNKYNQLHAVPNVYVTDGAFMTSAGCQNPSLSYMAFTARAANHAAQQLKNNKL